MQTTAQAAKQKISPPVFSLAAAAARPASAPDWVRFAKSHVTLNSHLGDAPPGTVLYPRQALVISSTVTGLQPFACDFCGGPRCTGKERDQETGLDYFGARYFSGAQGRFTSPDPTFLNILKVVNP